MKINLRDKAEFILKIFNALRDKKIINADIVTIKIDQASDLKKTDLTCKICRNYYEKKVLFLKKLTKLEGFGFYT